MLLSYLQLVNRRCLYLDTNKSSDCESVRHNNTLTAGTPGVLARVKIICKQYLTDCNSLTVILYAIIMQITCLHLPKIIRY